MTTPSTTSVNDGDCFKLENVGVPVSEGNICKPTGRQPMTMSRSVVSSVPRLSTISEHDPELLETGRSSHEPLGDSEWGGSTFSLFSDKYKNCSSRYSSVDSYQPDFEDDCAGILLACLHCHFLDLGSMLPGTCERAMIRCFPSYKYITASAEKDQLGDGCCNCNLELDCSCCSSCHDTAELLELAMEISEVCYR